MPSHTAKERKKKKVKRTTSKDMPGTGLAKKAAQAIEKQRREREKFLKSL